MKISMAERLSAEKSKTKAIASKLRGKPGVVEKPQRKVVWTNCLEGTRKSLGLSIDDVAKNVGLTPMGYRFIEKGVVSCRLHSAMKICEFFGKPVTEIFTQYRGDE